MFMSEKREYYRLKTARKMGINKAEHFADFIYCCSFLKSDPGDQRRKTGYLEKASSIILMHLFYYTSIYTIE